MCPTCSSKVLTSRFAGLLGYPPATLQLATRRTGQALVVQLSALADDCRSWRALAEMLENPRVLKARHRTVFADDRCLIGN
jgi:hypothetical protein